jgi:hypothetical protein
LRAQTAPLSGIATPRALPGKNVAIVLSNRLAEGRAEVAGEAQERTLLRTHAVRWLRQDRFRTAQNMPHESILRTLD